MQSDEKVSNEIFEIVKETNDMARQYYIHTQQIDALRGREIIEVTTQNDWMYALSKDEYLLSPRLAFKVKKALKKGLVLRVLGNQMFTANNQMFK